MKRFILLAGFSVAMMPVVGFASSDDAWEEFRTSVEQTCRELVEAPDNADIAVEVNPFGSESYGAALVTVDFGDEGEERMVCIYDKQSKDAELTGAFTPADQTETETE